MAQKHGNKNYYQVLIDPHRSKLIEKVAKEENMRGTAWVRQAAYEKLQRVMNTGEYKIAEAKDDLLWRQSVQRRIEGRKGEED
tara:strand:+ start:2133 stop:2381 length:249 start_codon:yes stop_codon:yes gene_type:complete